MDILMGFDSGYAMPAAVAIRSLCDALGRRAATVHILAVGLTADIRAKIAASASEPLEIRWYDFDDGLLSDLPMSSIEAERYISKTAYTVLFLDRYLPSNVERVMFLDADTLVRRSPDHLFATDLGSRILGAVHDFGCPAVGMPDGVGGWREMGLDGRLPYFNSGVVLVDRSSWREADVEARSVEYIRRFVDRIRYVDQDALNAVLADRWLPLDPAWNAQAHLEWILGGDDAVTYAFVDRSSLDQARRDPAIVHYAGSLKPWHWWGSNLPFADGWTAVLDRTAWAGERPSPPARQPTWKRAASRLSRAGKVLLNG